MARRRPTGLKLIDYSDIELLHIVDDCADEDGWSSSFDIAEQLGIRNDHARQCVASRFSWMCRYGWLRRHPDQALWAVTDVGHSLIDGRIPAAVQRTLDSLKPGDRVRVVRQLAESGARQANAARTMLRREWRRNMENGH